jgi:uncharacterized protein YggE
MVRKSAILVGCIFSLLTYLPTALAEDLSQLPKIEVEGKAKIMAMPNIAILSFAVETNAKSAQDAVNQNSGRTEKLLATIKKMIGKEDKVKTTGYSLSPIYEKGDRSRPEGYRVRNTVLVETNRLDKVGFFIDEAVKAGASGIGGLTFRTDQEEKLRKEAAVEAFRQAMVNAKELAKAAGLTIKRIIKVSYGPREPVFNYPGEANVQASAQTPITIGEIPIEARVTVTFEVN